MASLHPTQYGFSPTLIESSLRAKQSVSSRQLRRSSSRPSTKFEAVSTPGSLGIQDLKDELQGATKDEEVVSDAKKVACEFVLQAFFNFLSVAAVAMAVQNSGGDPVLQTVQVMAAHLVILPLTIYAGLETSGAHFNPMVTACFVLIGKTSAKLGVAYVAAQLAGGVLGAAAAFYSLPKGMQTLAHAGTQAVPAGSSVPQAFMGEAFAAFALIFVLMATNIDPRSKWGNLKPLAIPLIITLLMWLMGPVSSMCVNPARAFGPAVVTGFWEHHWIWWTAPFVGGLTAAKVYSLLFMPRSFFK